MKVRVAMEGNIVLVGFMGVGKSAVANFLRENRNMSVIDTDHLIEEKEGCSIQEIFKKRGEPYFRSLETKLLEELVTRKISNTVISSGGGMVLAPDNVALMNKLGKVVALAATPETIYQRVRDCGNRPLLKGDFSVEHISSILEGRKGYYEKASSTRIETDNKTVEEICELILS
jgi:shikimate kinase